MDSEWKRFSSTVSSQLELSWEKKQTSFFSFFVDTTVNFTLDYKPVSVNVSTMKLSVQGVSLDVRRIKQNYESEMQQYIEDLSKTKEVVSFSTVVQTKLNEIELLGLPDDLKIAKSKLVEMATKLQTSIPIDLGIYTPNP